MVERRLHVDAKLRPTFYVIVAPQLCLFRLSLHAVPNATLQLDSILNPVNCDYKLIFQETVDGRMTQWIIL